MATFEGHATKRQRTDVAGRGVQSGARDRFDESRKAPPSRVVLVGGLLGNVKEDDLVEAMQHFGLISYIKMGPRKGEALVEFEDMESSKGCVEYSQSHPSHVINVAGNEAFFDFYTRQRIPRPGEVEMEDEAVLNNVILLTIQDPQYPIDVHVIKKVTEKCGNVLRIVMIRKNGVQSMVEFDSIESATQAVHNLAGRDIYSGCCTIKIEYARPKTLTVYKNDTETFDYTKPEQVRRRGPALLDDPPEPRYNGPTVRPSGGGGRFGGPQGHPGPQRGRGRGFGHQQFYHGGYEEQGGFRGGRGQHMGGQHMGGYQQQDYDGYGAPNHGMQHSQQNLANSMGNGNRVVMVYGMNAEKMNCDRLFNLLCLYGNVWKVKFMKSKEGCAMVEMGDAYSVGLAISNLSNITFMDSTIQLGFSNQPELHNPAQHMIAKLPDGTPSFKDYSNTMNNRYLTERASNKNRLQRPNHVLHFFNAHPQTDEDRMKEVFRSIGLSEPIAFKLFEPKNDKVRSASGLIEWNERSEAIEALILGNHVPMENPGGRFPYTLKLCFSSQQHAV